MSYTSNAQWPDTISASPSEDNITTDTHDTKEQAEAVCAWLVKNGFGGDGEVFPLKVWVDHHYPYSDPGPNTLLPHESYLAGKDEAFYEQFSTQRLLTVYRMFHNKYPYDSAERARPKEDRIRAVMKRVLDKREHIEPKRNRRKKKGGL